MGCASVDAMDMEDFWTIYRDIVLDSDLEPETGEKSKVYLISIQSIPNFIDIIERSKIFKIKEGLYENIEEYENKLKNIFKKYKIEEEIIIIDNLPSNIENNDDEFIIVNPEFLDKMRILDKENNYVLLNWDKTKNEKTIFFPVKKEYSLIKTERIGIYKFINESINDIPLNNGTIIEFNSLNNFNSVENNRNNNINNIGLNQNENIINNNENNIRNNNNINNHMNMNFNNMNMNHNLNNNDVNNNKNNLIGNNAMNNNMIINNINNNPQHNLNFKQMNNNQNHGNINNNPQHNQIFNNINIPQNHAILNQIPKYNLNNNQNQAILNQIPLYNQTMSYNKINMNGNILNNNNIINNINNNINNGMNNNNNINFNVMNNINNKINNNIHNNGINNVNNTIINSPSALNGELGFMIGLEMMNNNHQGQFNDNLANNQNY